MMNYNPSDTGMTGTTQGICMDGWHIPSCDEWETLFYFLGGYKLQLPTGYTVYKGVGGKLKDTGPLWDQPNYGATNESGFSALPTGVFSGYGFDRKNMDAFWWSSMSYFNLALDFATTDIGVGTSSVDGVSAVRCIEDPPKK